MKKLYLMRHAEAGNNQIDKTRELTKFGISQSIRVADYIDEKNIEIDLILSSSSTRTKSTVEYMLKRLEKNIKVKYLDILYNQSSEIICDQIKYTSDNYQSLMIVSHNPSINDLVYKLSGDEYIIKPATLINFESKSTCWHQIDSVDYNFREIFYG